MTRRTTFKDYYKELGVSPNATDDEIKKAFRKLARKTHPDVHPGDKDAEARFKRVNEAYEVLHDPNNRRDYDAMYSPEIPEGTSVPQWQQPDTGSTTRRHANIDPLDLFYQVMQQMEQERVAKEKREREASRIKYERSRDFGSINLPDTDIGLLLALIKAHQSTKDGRWEVIRSKDDVRSANHVQGGLTIPYIVEVKVDEYNPQLRKINIYVNPYDWQDPRDAGKPIEKIEKAGFFKKKGVVEPRNLINMRYLIENKQNLKGVRIDPKAWVSQYLNTLDAIASTLAETHRYGSIETHATVEKQKKSIGSYLDRNRGYYNQPEAFRFGLGMQQIRLTPKDTQNLTEQRIREYVPHRRPEGQNGTPRGQRA